MVLALTVGSLSHVDLTCVFGVREESKLFFWYVATNRSRTVYCRQHPHPPHTHQLNVLGIPVENQYH